jgi:hypothetical protein
MDRHIALTQQHWSKEASAEEDGTGPAEPGEG